MTATNANGSPEQAFAVTVVPPAPRLVGSIEGVTLAEGATHAVTASDYFDGEGIAYAAGSSDTGVATVAVDGADVTVTAVAAGGATVTVTAANGAGSAEQSFAVTVVRPAPTAVGGIEGVTLTEGATHAVTASDYFSGEGITYAAASSDAAVAAVAVDGADVTVTAVAAGGATVTVEATNASGSAEQAFAVTVVRPAPVAVGSIEGVTLPEGATDSVTASDYFSGEEIAYTVASSDAAVATVAVDRAVVTVTAVVAGSATVTVTATNAGGSAEQRFAVTVVPPAPRVVGSIEGVTLAEGATHAVTASDYFSGEGIAYAAASSDTAVATVAVDGADVMVTAAAAGGATVTVTATNAGGSAAQEFVVAVRLPAVTLMRGGAQTIELSDYFGDEVTGYEVSVTPDGIVHASRSGSQLTLTGLAAGSATVTVTATNAGGSAEQSFAVTVLPPAPVTVGSIAAATITEGATHVVTASDYFDGEGIAYAAASSDTGVATVAVDGAVVTVTAVAVGSATVTVTATNAAGSAEQSFAVAVQLPAVTLTRGSAAHEIELSDYFGSDVTSYDVSVSPDGIVGVSMSGSQLTLEALAVGLATVMVEVVREGDTAGYQFEVIVAPPAPTTVGSIEAATITEGETHSVTASDYFSGDEIAYTVASSDTAVATVAVDGASVTVTAVAAGSATVTVTATNAAGSAEQSFAVTVVPPAPTAVGGIEGVTLAEGATHAVTASDYFDGEGIAYTATSSDTAVATVAVDGAVVTVTAVAVGSVTVTVTATNVVGSAAQSFAVTVLPPAPVTVGSIEAATITEGETHSVTASDYFSGDEIAYTVASSDTAVATVAVDGAAVTVTAVAAGSATVTVTATNASGSAEQEFVVAVRLPAVTLTRGSAAHEIELSDYFGSDVTSYGVSVSPDGIVGVSMSGSQLTLEALAVGLATVMVEVVREGDTAGYQFEVIVAPPAPTTVGSIEAATITEGETHSVAASDYFEFEGEDIMYTAGTSNTAVATVAVDGASVTVTAVAAGSATVTVTATNAAGSATQSFAVTVVPPAPTAVGGIEGVTLAEGATHAVTASDYFDGEGIAYTATSSDTAVATVAVDGASVTVTAVAAGSVTVTVTATNAVGTAEQRLRGHGRPAAADGSRQHRGRDAGRGRDARSHRLGLLRWRRHHVHGGVLGHGGGGGRRRWRGGDGDGGRRRECDGHGGGDERER